VEDVIDGAVSIFFGSTIEKQNTIFLGLKRWRMLDFSWPLKTYAPTEKYLRVITIQNYGCG
jgi:hypothetical protein